MYDKRDKQVGVRVSESELSAMTELAERMGITVPTLLRYLARRAIGLPTPLEPSPSH